MASSSSLMESAIASHDNAVEQTAELISILVNLTCQQLKDILELKDYREQVQTINASKDLKDLAEQVEKLKVKIKSQINFFKIQSDDIAAIGKRYDQSTLLSADQSYFPPFAARSESLLASVQVLRKETIRQRSEIFQHEYLRFHDICDEFANLFIDLNTLSTEVKDLAIQEIISFHSKFKENLQALAKFKQQLRIITGQITDQAGEKDIYLAYLNNCKEQYLRHMQLIQTETAEINGCLRQIDKWQLQLNDEMKSVPSQLLKTDLAALDEVKQSLNNCLTMVNADNVLMSQQIEAVKAKLAVLQPVEEVSVYELSVEEVQPVLPVSVVPVGMSSIFHHSQELGDSSLGPVVKGGVSFEM